MAGNDKNFVVKNGLNAGGVFTAGNTTITGDASISANLTSNNIIITNSVTSGTWAATIIAGQYGGTGVNNSGKTITLGGNLTTSGAFATTLTATATTNVTLPTTGTLSTLAGTETFTNKTFSDSTTFFQDESDNTKKAQLQLSGITGGATRTLTLQDASGTIALTNNKLSAFAATTSVELAGIISDETGAGALVFATTPTFATSVDSGASFSAWASATTLTEGYTGTAASTLNISTGAVTSATTKTINIGTGGVSGSITNLNFGSGISGATGTATFNNNVVVTGDLTVNGTTTTFNSTAITIDDKNIELGVVASPTNVTADGGGITLKGATDKTINWINATSAWTSSEDFDLVAGNTYRINNTLVANSTSLGTTIVGSSLTSVGNVAIGVWQGTIITGQYGGTGVNNTGRTITLAGNISTANSFTTSGNFALALTTTAATSVTLPTTGVLATLDGVETLTNKTLTAPTINNGGINSALLTTVTFAGAGAKFNGSTSGNTTVVATAVAGTTTLTLPAATDTLVGKNTTDTLTNKTLTSPSMSNPTVTGTLTANASVGSAGSVLASSGTGVYWLTPTTDLTDTANTSTVTILSSTGTDAIITEANTTAAGVLTSIAQNIAGTKTFTSQPVVPSLNISAAVPYMQLSDTDATGDWRVLVNTGIFVLQSSTDSYATNKMTVTSAGALTMLGDVTAFSDERLKSNVRTIDNALDKVSAMRGVYFDKDGRSSTGVIAQEIEKVLPEVVHDGEYKSVAYGNIVGVLIEAIKELQAKVDKLEKGV